MKKIIFACIVAMFFIGCTENPTGPSSGIYCYDKYLTYNDVTSPAYSQYYDKWISNNCGYTIASVCKDIKDSAKVITIQECVNGKFIPN